MPEDRPQCQGKTAKGTPCERRVNPGEESCWQHRGTPHKAGKRPKMTPEVISAVVKAIELGMTLKHAAQAANIAESTLHKYKRLGEAGDERFAEFAKGIKNAEARVIGRCFNNLHRAAETENKWQASAWVLERRFGYGLHNGQVQPGPMLQGLQSGEEETQRRTLITVSATMAMEARAKGDYATARGFMADVARLLALNPTDKAALERAGIGDSTLEVREKMEDRTVKMVQQAEEFVKGQAEGVSDGEG